MFGYVKINKMDLTFREYEHYRGYYCGLCKTLKDEHGEASRLTLNYDVTFLVVLLSGIYFTDEKVFNEGCITNPLKKKRKVKSEITSYCADMNILLSYYKIYDNLIDENRIIDKFAYNTYKKLFDKVNLKHEKKSKIIKENLDKLNSLEKENCDNIDLVSNTFGNVMAEVFSYKNDENEEILRNIGFNIGKYIYILDAFCDLDKDIKKNRYNPFISYKDKKEELKELVDEILKMCLGVLVRNIDLLDINKNLGIIENIVYSGMYERYVYFLNKGCEKNGK